MLQRTVNDDPATMTLLVRRLSYVNVHPYYVYVHDMVPGVEDLRTPLATAQRLEKHVRGATAGFNTPAFVLDTPGGGGKRDVHSPEHYDRATRHRVFTSPSVKPGKQFLYFDPDRLARRRAPLALDHARRAPRDDRRRAGRRDVAGC